MKQLVTNSIAKGYLGAFGVNGTLSDFVVQMSSSLEFGDVQSTIALSKSKLFKKSPKDIAAQIVTQIENSKELNGICSKITVGGNGYINFKFSNEQLASFANTAIRSDKVGAPDSASNKSTVVAIDYSSPNIAKEMHVVSIYIYIYACVCIYVYDEYIYINVCKCMW